MKQMRFLYLAVLSTLMIMSCQSKQEVSLILHNGVIYTVNEKFDIQQAVAVKDDRFVEVGSSKEILEKYAATTIIDLGGNPVYPGFIDAHCHFYGYGLSVFQVDLIGTGSFEEVLDKVLAHQENNPSAWIQGRGWDQNDWEVKEYPTKDMLDSLFPNTPVFIRRVDGHAALVNQKALDEAGITSETQVEGGEIIIINGELTGILIDNAMDLVKKVIPEVPEEEMIRALLRAQEDCFAVGLTTVDDAGLGKDTIELIDRIQKEELLKMRIYAMVNSSRKSMIHYLKMGKYKTDRLNVSSIKFYGDGALGSRGACLLQPYSDVASGTHHGFMVNDVDTLQKFASMVYEAGFQMNTHCIGDSANRSLLNIYSKLLKGKNDRRWRIEHAQVIAPEDFMVFGNYSIIPSVQPTHATSDMYWVEDRLDSVRVKGAYAYRKLLDQNGLIVNGSDFPVESINPLYGFYAAVARKDHKGFPEQGFHIEEGLTREEALKAMTIWAAYSNFEEEEKGSIEIGKFADFVILEKDLFNINIEEIITLKVLNTYIGGELVY